MTKSKNFIFGTFNLYIPPGLVTCNPKRVVLPIWAVGIKIQNLIIILTLLFRSLQSLIYNQFDVLFKLTQERVFVLYGIKIEIYMQ